MYSLQHLTVYYTAGVFRSLAFMMPASSLTGFTLSPLSGLRLGCQPTPGRDADRLCLSYRILTKERHPLICTD